MFWGRFEDGAPVALKHRHDMSSKFSLFGNMKLSEDYHHRYSDGLFLVEECSYEWRPALADTIRPSVCSHVETEKNVSLNKYKDYESFV